MAASLTWLLGRATVNRTVDEDNHLGLLALGNPPTKIEGTFNISIALEQIAGVEKRIWGTAVELATLLTGLPTHHAR